MREEEAAQGIANPLQSKPIARAAGHNSKEQTETKGVNLGFDFVEDLFQKIVSDSGTTHQVTKEITNSKEDLRDYE